MCWSGGVEAMMPERFQQATIKAPRQIQLDPGYIRWPLIFLAVGVVGVLVIVPLVNVFYHALSSGLGVYFDNLFHDPDTRDAILLTLTVAPIALLASGVRHCGRLGCFS